MRSSFDGVVTRVWRGPGALVDGTASTPIVQLAATAAEFDADATERQLVGLAPEQPVSIRLATAGNPLSGTLRTRSTALDPATGLGLVRIIIADPPALTLGVYGEATVTIGRRDDVLIVPAPAMRGAVADGAELVVCSDGKADVRAVKVGWRDNDRVEVTDGVKEGESVAIDHVLGLETGTPLAQAK